MSGKYIVVIQKQQEKLNISKVLVSVLCVVLVSTHWELNLTAYYL